jgi:hypothetical protein
MKSTAPCVNDPLAPTIIVTDDHEWHLRSARDIVAVCWDLDLTTQARLHGPYVDFVLFHQDETGRYYERDLNPVARGVSRDQLGDLIDALTWARGYLDGRAQGAHGLSRVARVWQAVRFFMQESVA